MCFPDVAVSYAAVPALRELREEDEFKLARA